MSFETGAYQNAVATLNPAGAPHPAPGDPSFAVRVKPVDAVFTLSLSDSCSIPNHVSVQVRAGVCLLLVFCFFHGHVPFLVGRRGSQLEPLRLYPTRFPYLASYLVWCALPSGSPLVLLVCTLHVCIIIFVCLFSCAVWWPPACLWR